MFGKVTLLSILFLAIIYSNVLAKPTDEGEALATNVDGPITLDERYRNHYMYRYPNSYYKYHRIPGTFAKAQMICQNEKSHLAIINLDVDALYLSEIMNQNLPTADPQTISSFPITNNCKIKIIKQLKKNTSIMSGKVKLLPTLLLPIIFSNILAKPTDEGEAPATNVDGPVTSEPRFRNDYMYRYQNSYYKYHRSPRTFAKAQIICHNEKSHLAIINSDDEAHFLVELMTKNPPTADVDRKDYVLIGFHDAFGTGNHFTIDGLPLDSSGYTTFGVNEPTYDGQCGSVHRDGTLNDFPCDIKSPFICEHTLNSGMSLGSRAQDAENENIS